MEVLDSLDALLVEVGGRRCGVEVQVSCNPIASAPAHESRRSKGLTTKDLITTLSTENHLDSHSLDLSTQKVHRCGGPDGRHIVRLEVVDDIGDGVESLLNGEGVLVVDGSKVLGRNPRGEEIRRVLESDRERVEAGPGGESLLLLLDLLLRRRVRAGHANKTVRAASGGSATGASSTDAASLSDRDLVRHATSDRSDERTVESTREEHTVGHLTHQALLDGVLERLPHELVVDLGGGDRAVGLVTSVPGGLEVALRLAGRRVVNVTGGEGDDLVAFVVERLELGSEVDAAGVRGRRSLIERRDSYWVTGGDHAGGGDGSVEEDEGEHAVELAAEGGSVLLVLVGGSISS